MAGVAGVSRVRSRRLWALKQASRLVLFWDANAEQLKVERFDGFGSRWLGVRGVMGGNGFLDIGWRSAILQ